MSYPITAFERILISDALPGDMLLTSTGWSLRGDLRAPSAPVPKLLQLTGDRAGYLAGIGAGTALKIIAPYSWEVRIDSLAHIDCDEYVARGRLVIGMNGKAAIWGAIADAAHHGITLEGKPIEGSPDFNQVVHPWFDSYSIWLRDGQGTVGNEPLFKVAGKK